MAQTLFWISAVASIVCALGVILSRQALQSVLWMFALLLSLSGAMVALGAYLLALVTVLVYAGAILVLFTFVVMFMGQQPVRAQIGRARFWWALLATVGVFVLFAPACGWASQGGTIAYTNSLPLTPLYGPELFYRYQLPTQLAAWILLWVAVGAFNIMGPAKEKTSREFKEVNS